MHRTARLTWGAGAVALVLIPAVMVSAETKQKAFENSWVRRHVVVKQPLYSLVYKERGLRGSVSSKRDGLTVVTPFNGMYFQFAGRHGVDDVTDRDVRKIAPAVKLAYLKDQLLDDVAVQVVDPVMLTRYEPGTELVVRAARVSVETVRLELSLAADVDHDLATSLTVQWPAQLSKSFSERVDVEGLIQQVLSVRE